MKSDTSTGETNCTYWTRKDAREFITDPNGEIVNLARLTLYAKSGKEIYDAQSHHQLPLLKIDAPAFLDALSQTEHGQLHRGGSDPVEVDGIPMLCSDG